MIGIVAVAGMVAFTAAVSPEAAKDYADRTVNYIKAGQEKLHQKSFEFGRELRAKASNSRLPDVHVVAANGAMNRSDEVDHRRTRFGISNTNAAVNASRDATIRNAYFDQLKVQQEADIAERQAIEEEMMERARKLAENR